MHNRKSLIVLLTAWSLFFCLCRSGEPKIEGAPTIAFVVKTVNHPYFMDMEQGARQAAAAHKVNLVVQGPEREVDIEKQMQIIENLIQRRVDVLCIVPCGSREIVPAIVKANRAKIPVVTVDTRVDGAQLAEAGGRVETFIGSDNYTGGKLAGEYLARQLNGRGHVALLEGIPGHETGDARKRGFVEALASFPGMKIVSSQTANWERDQGFNVFQNIIQSHPEVNALFACNDLMALGAVEAIAAAGRTGEIRVVGFDALKDAKTAIGEGRMRGTVAQYPSEMGREAVNCAMKILQGEEVAEEIPVKIELITAESLENSQ